jgi:hypothetical protein
MHNLWQPTLQVTQEEMYHQKDREKTRVRKLTFGDTGIHRKNPFDLGYCSEVQLSRWSKVFGWPPRRTHSLDYKI